MKSDYRPHDKEKAETKPDDYIDRKFGPDTHFFYWETFGLSISPCNIRLFEK
jgi:hypothetical protein